MARRRASLPVLAPRPPRSPAERAERLRAAIAALRERYGPRVIRTGAEMLALPPAPEHAPLTTGSLGLDLVTGGLPRGGIAEYAGRDGAGKEALALAALAACQRAGGATLLLDADHAADPDALADAGVDVARLVWACPTTAGEAWHIVRELARCHGLDLLVVCSLPGLMGLPGAGWGTARLARGLRGLSTSLRGSPTAVVLTNHPYPISFAAPAGIEETAGTEGTLQTIGGAAIAQAARLRVALRAEGMLFTEYGDLRAARTVATVVKHRGLAHGLCLPLEIGPAGPSRAAELVVWGRRTGALAETALGLALDGRLLGRGDERAATTLAADTDLAAEVERRIRALWPPTSSASHAARGARRGAR